MTGAGSSTVAWAPEQSYLGGTGTSPTYREPGANIQIQTAELTRNLLEIVAPDDPETQDFLSQNLDGQLGISWILRTDDYHRLLFNDGFTSFTSGLVNSAEWYLGVDYIGGTTERQIKGWAPATAEVVYNGTEEAVRVTVTGPFGDEEQNTSITPGTIQRAGDEVPGHGATLSVNNTEITKLQSATVSLEQISRLQTGPEVKPLDAVQGNVQESVDMTAIYEGPEQYKLALGGPTANTVESQVDAVPVTLDFDVAGTAVASYDFATAKPETYSWEDLANNDADLNETVNFRATGITASDPTA
jgi:hypothetical protein